MGTDALLNLGPVADPFIQITFLVDHGERRPEAEARQIQYKLIAYAEKLGVDNTFVEDTDGSDD